MFFINTKEARVPIPVYLKNGSTIQEWIINSKDIDYLKFKNNFFYILDKDNKQDISYILTNIDKFIESGSFTKQSDTRASIFLYKNKKYFGKAAWLSKSIWYKQIKYYFLPPRSYWAAAVAQKLTNASILTPQVFAAGEYRQFGRLMASYLLTEAESNLNGLNNVLASITQEKLLFELFLQISESIEQLHSAGIGHEDLVPSNLYVSNGNIGFWDLDSCLLFKQETPIKYRIKEYSMFLRTAKTIISNNKNICQTSELLKELTKILTKPLEKISSSAYARLQI